MKRIQLTITDELEQAIQAALKKRGMNNRSAAIEKWLWSIRAIRQGAEKQRLKRKERSKWGRKAVEG